MPDATVQAAIVAQIRITITDEMVAAADRAQWETLARLCGWPSTYDAVRAIAAPHWERRMASMRAALEAAIAAVNQHSGQ